MSESANAVREFLREGVYAVGGAVGVLDLIAGFIVYSTRTTTHCTTSIVTGQSTCTPGGYLLVTGGRSPEFHDAVRQLAVTGGVVLVICCLVILGVMSSRDQSARASGSSVAPRS